MALVQNASFTMSGGSIAGCTAETGGGISCSSNGNMIKMSGTALIRDCRSKDLGGGIWIYGELYMTGNATIRGCIAGEPGNNMYIRGGGVLVNSTSTLVMSESAVIEDCKAVNDADGYTAAGGGGVCVLNGASLTMSGDTRILNCSAERSGGLPSSYGGGVSAHTATQITLEGNARIDQGSAPKAFQLPG